MIEPGGAPPQSLLESLRATDPDRYVATLYAPEKHRGALAALYAFNAEIAAIRDRISEPMPGEIRLQWWRDVIGAPDMASAAAGNPLAAELARVIARYDLPKSAFANYLDARIFDLYDDPMPGRNAFEGYAGETNSILFQLAAQILNDGAVADTADASGHAGIAHCVATVLRALPLHRARGQVYVPGDLLAAAGLDAQEFLSGENKEACARAVAATIALGRDHLGKAERAIAGLEPHLKVAFLPLAIVAPVLSLAEKHGARILSEPLQLSALRRMWVMFLRTAFQKA